MNQILKKYTSILLILSVYLRALAIFTFFRLILFALHFDRLNPSGDSFPWIDVLTCLLMGIRFDTVVSAYLLALPFLLLTSFFIVGNIPRIIFTIVYYYTIGMFSAAFFISAADIPYFNQYFSRINIAAFQWIDNPVFVLKMIFSEPEYFLYIIPFVGLSILFALTAKKVFVKIEATTPVFPRLSTRIYVSVVMLVVMFVAIRGRIDEKSPIRIGTAFFCSNSFLNQAGLNPVFVFFNSCLEKTNKDNDAISFMEDDIALRNVRKYFGMDDEKFSMSLERNISPDSLKNNDANIVLVIMESMSASKMGRYGSKMSMTPFLDSLANVSISFNQIYTAGIHTYNGIYSSLFSFPALFMLHPMKNADMKKYNGLSYWLRKSGYTNYFFTSHDGQFDNIEGFLMNNDFDRVYSKKDYPQEKILSTLGVPDDYLLKYALKEIDDVGRTGKPFFAAILTSSDHGPYVVPHYYETKTKDVKIRAVEYADWSLKKFLRLASSKKWFNNTYFIFIADHGAAIDPIYEIPLSYHHTPLIIFSPILKESKTVEKIGGQIDVFPTIMGLLKLPYINNTLGIDLLKETRPAIYFTADNKYGVLSDSLFLIADTQGRESLFRYRDKDIKNYIGILKNESDKLKEYAQSNMQTSGYILKNEKQFIRLGSEPVDKN